MTTPLLLVLNGPPAAGKSTLARRYADDHPGALALDIDVVRSMLGRWHATPIAAGLRARQLALACAADHLGAGFDVVVPQLIARPELLDALAEVAVTAGARYREVLLSLPPALVRERFERRTALGDRPEHLDAAELGGVEELSERLTAFAADRPELLRLAVDGSVSQTYEQLLQLLGEGMGGDQSR